MVCLKAMELKKKYMGTVYATGFWKGSTKYKKNHA